MTITNTILKTFVRYKIYFDRSKVYISYVQFLMLVFITLKQMNTELPILLYLALFVAFVILSLVIGYIDTKAGIREEEQKNYTEQNPVITDIHKIVKELKEKSRN